MKTVAAFVLLGLAQAAFGNVIERAACNADNCARRVTGTFPSIPTAVRKTDCANYQTTTVTPPAVTVTNYVLPPAAPVVPRGMAIDARQAPAPTVPAYASPCPGSAQYRSACSCWGFTSTVTTAPTPTVTVTATATPGFCDKPGECGTFEIIYSSDCGPLGSCACAHGVNGPVCVENAPCNGVTCNADADCGQGKVCWTQNCCGYNICTAPANLCVNIVAPSRLFRRSGFKAGDGQKKRGECSGLTC